MMGVPGIHDVDPEDHERAWKIMRQLRPALEKAAFEAQLAEQPDYRLVGSYTPQLSGVIGIRLIEPQDSPRIVQVEDLVVAETFRGQGIGRALMSYAEAEARRMRCPRLNVECGEAGLPFCQALGYRVHENGVQASKILNAD